MNRLLPYAQYWLLGATVVLLLVGGAADDLGATGTAVGAVLASIATAFGAFFVALGRA